MAVFVENESRVVFDLKDPARVIKKAVAAVMEDKNIPPEMEVNILITTPSVIRRTNSETRGIDNITDVLSFPYFEFDTPGRFRRGDAASGGEILGDIMICASKIKEQAARYGHSQKRELSFLTVHSMLHLLGYDHTDEEAAALMRKEEDRIMNDVLKIKR